MRDRDRLLRWGPLIAAAGFALAPGARALAQQLVEAAGPPAPPAPQAQMAVPTITAQAAGPAGPTVNAGEVSATGGGGGGSTTPAPGATQVPTQQQIFQSGDTVRVLDQNQMKALGPVVGGQNLIALAPGAQVTSYGNSGAQKATVQLNGIGQGWGGYGGYTGGGDLSITLDGVPIVDPLTSLWPSATVPIGLLMQGPGGGTTVSYGPGDPVNRWYTSLGGNIEFTPVQPTVKAGADVNLSYGSFNAEQLYFDLRTGVVDGWSSVLAVGAGTGNDFRTGTDGFNNPYNDYEIYSKTVKKFTDGDISFMGYYGKGCGYRSQVIPGEPNPYISVAGNSFAPNGTNSVPNPGQPYSEKTSGFYSSAAQNIYNKYDCDAALVLDAKQNYRLDSTTTLHNMTYFWDDQRLHSRTTDQYIAQSSGVNEYNNPSSSNFGDKLWLTETLPWNTVDLGGYYQYATYNTRNSFWTQYPPFNATYYTPNGLFRNDYWNQTDLAVFLQDDISPIKSIHITPGIRFVNFQTQYTPSPYSVFSPNATGTPQGLAGGGAQQQNRTGLEPSLSTNWQAAKWLAFYGSYSEAYKTPAVGGGGGLYQSIPGNYANLELGQYAMVGFKVNVDKSDFLLNKFLAGANYFWMRDAKQSINTALANGAAITASGTSILQGADFFLDDNPVGNLHTFLNGAYESAYYSNYQTGTPGSGGGNYAGLPVPYVPSMTMNIGADYQYTVGDVLLKPSAFWQMTGTQYVYDNFTGLPSKQQLQQYNTFNVEIDATMPLPNVTPAKNVTFSLAILNLLNTHYNGYEYLSAGGYFNTANSPGAGGPNGAGYGLYYPGAPITLYGSVAITF